MTNLVGRVAALVVVAAAARTRYQFSHGRIAVASEFFAAHSMRCRNARRRNRRFGLRQDTTTPPCNGGIAEPRGTASDQCALASRTVGPPRPNRSKQPWMPAESQTFTSGLFTLLKPPWPTSSCERKRREADADVRRKGNCELRR